MIKQLDSSSISYQEQLVHLYADGLEDLSLKYKFVRKFVKSCLKNDLMDIKANYIESEGSSIIVAFIDESIVGMVCLAPFNKDIAEIKRISVLKERRRNGIASALLNEVERVAETLGYKSVRLTTLGPMISAQELYKKSGYTLLEENMVGKGESSFVLLTYGKLLLES